MRSPADNYIYAHPRSAVLWYRRDVPKDVRLGIGKSRWKRSLGTSIRAEALRKARRLALDDDAAIEAARRANGTADLSSLTPDERTALEAAGGVAGFLDWLEARAKVADAAKREAALIREGVAAGSAPLSPDPDYEIDPDWAMARTAGLDAERQAIESQLGQSATTLEKLGATPARLTDQKRYALAARVADGLADKESITLSGVMARWQKAKNVSAPEQFQYPVRLFEDLHGRIPVALITKAHVREFRDVLPEVPRAGGAKFAGMTLQERVEVAQRKDLPRLGEKTAAKYHRSIKTILAFAVEEGYLSDNPADGIKTHKRHGKFSERRKQNRRSFAPAEYVKLLEFAATTKADKPEDLWFLRLKMWTGARGEELAQLAPRDVRKVGGVLCLDIHDRGDNRLKTESSPRKIPLHPSLLAAGFESFVAGARGPHLFSTLKPNAKGRRYPNMGGRLGRLLRSAGITDPRVVPYCTRHSFKDAARVAKIPEDIVEAIMGHRDPGHRTARGYGEEQVRVLAEWIAKVDPLDASRTVTEFEPDPIEEA